MSDFVTLSVKKYNRLLKMANELQALEAHGVDNWEWYGEAMSSIYGEDDDEEEE